MTTLERVLFLRRVGAFAALGAEELADVAQVAEEVEHASGEEVLRQGDVDEALYVIAEGRIAVVAGGQTQTVLDERQLFGELSLLDPAPRATAAVALTDVTLLKVDAEVFRALAREKPAVALGVATSLARRLRAQGSA